MKAKLLVFISVLLMACAQVPPEQKPLQAPALRLVGGGSLSLAGADEYNLVLLQSYAQDRLYLLFASNRSCDACEGHNLFLAASQAEVPYDEIPRQLPPFETPQVIKPGGSPINSSSRISFAAFVDSETQIKLYFNDSNNTIYKIIVPVNEPSASGEQAGIMNYMYTPGTLIGQGYGQTVFVRDSAGNVRGFYPDSYESQPSEPYSLLRDAMSVMGFYPPDVGYMDAFFYLIGERILVSGQPDNAETSTAFGEHRDLNGNLAFRGLRVHSLHMADFGYDVFNMLLFSAHDGRSLDLYAVTSHSPRELWAMVAPLLELPW